MVILLYTERLLQSFEFNIVAHDRVCHRLVIGLRCFIHMSKHGSDTACTFVHCETQLRAVWRVERG